jgi:hypothetical protein
LEKIDIVFEDFETELQLPFTEKALAFPRLFYRAVPDAEYLLADS